MQRSKLKRALLTQGRQQSTAAHQPHISAPRPTTAPVINPLLFPRKQTQPPSDEWCSDPPHLIQQVHGSQAHSPYIAPAHQPPIRVLQISTTDQIFSIHRAQTPARGLPISEPSHDQTRALHPRLHRCHTRNARREHAHTYSTAQTHPSNLHPAPRMRKHDISTQLTVL